MNLLLLLLAVPLGLILAFALLERLIRSTPAGVILVIAAVLFGLVTESSLLLAVGGTSIFFNDIAYTLLLVAAFGRMLRTRQRMHGLQLLLLLFFGLAVASLLRGALMIDPNGALAEFRKYHAFLSAALFFSTVPAIPALWDRIGLLWLRFAGVLVCLAVIRWVALALGLSGGVFGEGDTTRVLASGDTLVLAQALIITMVGWDRPDRLLLRWAAPVLLAFVIALQHRTVWVVTFACLGAYVVRDRRLGPKLVGLIAAAVVAVGLLSFTILDDETEPLGQQLSQSATDVGTWEWRIEGWRALLVETGPTGPVEMVFGKPFGSGFERRVDSHVVAVSPHNFYVETFLRVGAVGFVLLLVLYLWPLRVLSEGGGRSAFFTNQVLFALMLTFVLFSIPYSPRPEQGVLFGLLLAAASQHRAETVAPERPDEPAVGARAGSGGR